MTSTFQGGNCYTQSAEVLAYLKIANAQQSDIDLLDNTLIPLVCNYIDTLAGTTWGSIEITEVLSVGKPAAYGLYLIGAPINLSFYPLIPYIPGTQSFVSFKVFNGNGYQEWAGVQNESRQGSYWVSPHDGRALVIGWYWYMGEEVEVTYAYGYNTSGTPFLDGEVHELALLKASEMFLSNERYTALVSEGIGGVEMKDQKEYLDKRIHELEGYIKGWQTISSDFIS